MKIFQITAWSVFFLGIILHFLHISDADLWCAAGGFLLIFLFAIIFCFKNVLFKKEDKQWLSALMHFAFAFLSLFVLFRIMVWPCSIIFNFAVLITFIYFVVFLVVFFVNRKPFKLPQILLLVYFAASVFLYYIPTHRIYKATYMSQRNEQSYFDWNLYSWYLYRDGKYDEAIKANHKAQELVRNDTWQNLDEVISISSLPNPEGVTYREWYLFSLQSNEQKILNKTWKNPDDTTNFNLLKQFLTQ